MLVHKEYQDVLKGAHHDEKHSDLNRDSLLSAKSLGWLSSLKKEVKI